MGDNPPAERHPRTSRPAFSTPEPTKPPAEQTKPAPGRATKAAPPVTFQPPGAENHPGETPSRTPRDTTNTPAVAPERSTEQPPATPKPPARRRAKATPASAPAQPATSDPATPATQPKAATPAKPIPPAKAPSPAKPIPPAKTPSRAQPIPPAEPSPSPKAVPPAQTSANDVAGVASEGSAPSAKPSVPAATAPAAKKAAPAKRTPRKAPPAKATRMEPAQPTGAASVEATPAEPAPDAETAASLKPTSPPKQRRAAPIAPATVESTGATAEARPTTPVEPTTPAKPNTPTEATSATASGAPTTRPAAELPVETPVTPIAPARIPTNLPADDDAGTETEPWAKLIADPGHAPELLALAAVQTLGARAKDWAETTRTTYPDATPDALARLATRQFTRFGGLASVFGAVAGSYAPIALLGTAAITEAELVLHLAAAYGLDPTDPRRAVDLLVIARVHPSVEEAEEAVAAARRPAYEDEGGFSGAVWRLGRLIAAQSANWGFLRLASRYFPGSGLLAAILSGTAKAESAAARATAFYTQVSQDLGSKS